MSQAHSIDVSAVIEKQKINAFLVLLVTISWTITALDGLDSNLVSFAAPYFRAQFRLTTVQTGNIFSIHQVGTLIGGILFAYIGDLIGRRYTIILATTLLGLLTIGFYFANSYSSLFALRLIDGVPLGGMLPLAWALNIEYAPRRYRATIVTMIMIGYSLGTAFGGPLANWLIPEFGWKAVFVAGGGAALGSAGFLLWRLPESIRFLATKGKHPARIAAHLRRIAPEEEVPSEATFIVTDEPGHLGKFDPSLLFRGELRQITPLLWTAYIASSFAVFFLVSWTPLVFEALGYNRAQATTSSSVLSLMGALGGVLLMRFTDQRGAIAVSVMPIVSAILLLVVGLVNMGPTAFLILNAAVGLFLIGGHFGIHSISGLFYPSAYRANGAGWATSIAKVGSICGPIIGGWILATRFPIRNMFALLAVCPILVAACVYAIGRIQLRSLRQQTVSYSVASDAVAGG